jgi:hypothetical protein
VRAHAAAALALVALAGCGGSGATSKRAGESPHDRWARAADAACDRAEAAIRGYGQPRDLKDLERLLVRAGDRITGAADDITALEVPQDSRSRVAPFLRDLKTVPKEMRRLRDAADSDDYIQLGDAVAEVRTAGITIADHAEAAGLKRCGRREQIDAAADEATMPAFAEGLANELAGLGLYVLPIADRLRRELDPKTRARLWERLSAQADKYESATETPKRLRELEDRYGLATYEIDGTADELQVYLLDGRLAKARRMEAKVQRAIRLKIPRLGLELLREAGASGRRWLPAVRRALRRG